MAKGKKKTEGTKKMGRDLKACTLPFENSLRGWLSSGGLEEKRVRRGGKNLISKEHCGVFAVLGCVCVLGPWIMGWTGKNQRASREKCERKRKISPRKTFSALAFIEKRGGKTQGDRRVSCRTREDWCSALKKLRRMSERGQARRERKHDPEIYYLPWGGPPSSSCSASNGLIPGADLWFRKSLSGFMVAVC